jgi:hypothetical protein
MGWFYRDKTSNQESKAAAYVLRVALAHGDLISAMRTAGSHALPLGPIEMSRAVERLRASDRTDAQKAEQLVALLYPLPFSNLSFVYSDSEREQFAEEAIRLDPSLKARVARVPSISGPLRVRLVREMLDEKKVAAGDILDAIPRAVLPPNAWDVEFCQRLVAYALEKGEIHTAYATAVRLGRTGALPATMWEDLMARGLEATRTGKMKYDQFWEVALIASA